MVLGLVGDQGLQWQNLCFFTEIMKNREIGFNQPTNQPSSRVRWAPTGCSSLCGARNLLIRQSPWKRVKLTGLDSRDQDEAPACLVIFFFFWSKYAHPCNAHVHTWPYLQRVSGWRRKSLWNSFLLLPSEIWLAYCSLLMALRASLILSQGL